MAASWSRRPRRAGRTRRDTARIVVLARRILIRVVGVVLIVQLCGVVVAVPDTLAEPGWTVTPFGRGQARCAQGVPDNPADGDVPIRVVIVARGIRILGPHF